MSAITQAADITAEVLADAEEIYSGWYEDTRIDWDDFLYRLESRTGIDLGTEATSPAIRRIQSHIRAFRKL